MGSLSYLCWAVCILQVAVGEARPDFGTSLTFTKTADVSALGDELGTLIASVDETLQFTLSSLTGGSAVEQLTYYSSIASGLAEDGSALAAALSAATASNTDLEGTFGELQDGFDSLSGVLNSATTGLPASVGGFMRSAVLGVVAEMASALEDVVTSFTALETALATASQSSDVAPTVFQQLVSSLLEARNTLPLLVFVFQSAGRNIQQADQFYAGFQQSVAGMQEPLVDAYNAYETSIGDALSYVVTEYNAVAQVYAEEDTQLAAGLVGSIEDTAAYASLTAALDVFRVDGLNRLLAFTSTVLPAAKDTFLPGLQQALYAVPDATTVYDGASELASYLVQSGANAPYCFAYSEALVNDLPAVALLQANECLDVQRPRLCRLRDLLVQMSDLLVYDVQDLWENLEVCVAASEAQQNACVEALTSFYAPLGNLHLQKYDLLTALVQTEVKACLKRLQICFAKTDMYTFGSLTQSLTQDMATCFSS